MARRSAEEEQRKRKMSEMRRTERGPELGVRRGGTNMSDRRMPDERGRRPDYGQAPRVTRGTENRRPQTGVPCSSHRPSQSEIESEYRTDQILMHLYPEREIRPRW